MSDEPVATSAGPAVAPARLSDLLDAQTFDAAGEPLGRVRDVRLAQDGPYREGFGHGLRVAGLLVGRRGIGARLGFLRADVNGPWPIDVVLRRLERSADYYDWSSVDEWRPGRLTLRPGALPSTPPDTH
jgi:hypothetical protein